MNITEAVRLAIDADKLISRTSQPEYFLKYIQNGCFFQYQIINGKSFFKYEVWDFTVQEVLSNDWITIPDTFFNK